MLRTMLDPWRQIDPHGKLRDTLREQSKIAEMSRGVSWAANVADVLKGITPMLQIDLDYVGSLRLPADLGRKLQVAWDAGLADNWRGMDDDEVYAAVDLMVS